MGRDRRDCAAGLSPDWGWETVKAQGIRLLDVFLIGPLMVVGGSRSSLTEPWRTLLVVSGVLTMLYNGANYLTERKNDGI